MSFENKEAELGLLLTRMQDQPQDWHELYEKVRLKLNELKAYGMPLPRIWRNSSMTWRQSSSRRRRTQKDVHVWTRSSRGGRGANASVQRDLMRAM